MLQLTKENDWGNGKIEREFLQLGYSLSNEIIANILKHRSIPLSRTIPLLASRVWLSVQQ